MDHGPRLPFPEPTCPWTPPTGHHVCASALAGLAPGAVPPRLLLWLVSQPSWVRMTPPPSLGLGQVPWPDGPRFPRCLNLPMGLTHMKRENLDVSSTFGRLLSLLSSRRAFPAVNSKSCFPPSVSWPEAFGSLGSPRERLGAVSLVPDLGPDRDLHEASPGASQRGNLLYASAAQQLPSEHLLCASFLRRCLDDVSEPSVARSVFAS